MTATANKDGKYNFTIHWATARDGFDSILTAYNYYGYAFPKLSTADTDADLEVRAFDESGQEQPLLREPIATGGSLHISLGKRLPGFQGLVSARMVPKGQMSRLRNAPRPIDTSFFMLYQRSNAFRDFSHELFAVQESAGRQSAEWATDVHRGRYTRIGVVVLNNRPGQAGTEFESEVTLRLTNLDGSDASEKAQLRLAPGGSRFVDLEELLQLGPEFARDRGYVCVVSGRNIEQPMSAHLHQSGDFNFHHF